MDRQIRKDILFEIFWLLVPKGQFFLLLSFRDTSNLSKTVDMVSKMLNAIEERINEENVIQ
jgi:hypothetical protein